MALEPDVDAALRLADEAFQTYRASTGAARAAFLDRIGEEIMAIGDALNDVPMLQAAGVAVAMDNAHPEVKLAADWVAPSNNDHGVHAALARYGLC